MSKRLYFLIYPVLALILTSISYGSPGNIRLDFDDRENVNTEPGFTSFLISDNGKTVNGITIFLAGNMDDRRRTNPHDDEFPVPYEQIYRDFIYGIQPSGVTITLFGLGVNQSCKINLYAYDAESEPTRAANWYANGTFMFTADFNGGAIHWPDDITDYNNTATVTADGYGRIILTSTRNPISPTNAAFAFVNALLVTPQGAYIQPDYATNPQPADDKTGVSPDVVLSWTGGGHSAGRDVYFGSDEAKVTDANRSNPLGVLVSENHLTTTYTPPGLLDLNKTYYWRIDEVNDPNIWKGLVWSFTTRMPVLTACNPVPLDGAEGVPADVNLSWEKGEYAEKHDVYFGTYFNNVNNANRSNPLGVLVSQGQSTTTYELPEFLYSDTTYYWRIDEVNGPTIWKGEVWSFFASYVTPPRTIDPPYEVGTWQGFKTAAISYTFDDGRPSLYSTAIPMFGEPNFGFKLTAFITTEQFGTPNWTALQNAAAVGHEIASHTVTHPDLTSLNDASLTAELVNSQNTINSYIPGPQCDTLAYPNCSTDGRVNAKAAKYYIAARVCSGAIEGNTPANFYAISSFVCGTGGVNSLANFTSKFTSTAASQGWCVFLIHGLDGDTWYSPLSSATLRSSLDYLNANRSTFWVQTFGNVVRYIRERNDVSVAELSNDGNSITLQVTDTLNDTIYNCPVTIRRPLPAGWPCADVYQDDQMINAGIVDINSVRYIMFDVVPDGGNVMLSKGYGDFTDDGIVDMNDLSIFCSYWLVDDCEETEGVDLDEDCLVNFYEYAFLAKNWLLHVPE